ncbi:prenyltransferase [Aeromicrobium sp. Leaf350]|uniref:prenyltransferase n=1 Tax=Aeromicrobium sp. Leaf350 TaxID=2876565 RepID=UPI001E4E9CBF|nr:prenyltransferase [Aeromicrobium sp. Leaf350]
MTPADLELTAAWVAEQQEESGAVPWFAGGHLDPWDHVQAAMGLLASGRREAADRAYRWSARSQRLDGTWAAKYVDGEAVEHYVDANFTTYLAVGVWHHHLVTGDDAFARELWPVVDAAVAAVLPLQRPDGAFVWTPGEPEALVTGNASIAFSLRCALGLARVVGAERPVWAEASTAVATAVRQPDLFAAKPHSMDWYYPLLGAPWTSDEVERRIKDGWDTYVVPGLGIKCVTPNTWVTGAESCELVLALDASGRRDEALQVFDDMQHLREDDGSYWTGYEYESRQRWPDERTTWTAATVLLAHDALHGVTGGSGLFRGEGL